MIKLLLEQGADKNLNVEDYRPVDLIKPDRVQALQHFRMTNYGRKQDRFDLLKANSNHYLIEFCIFKNSNFWRHKPCFGGHCHCPGMAMIWLWGHCLSLAMIWLGSHYLHITMVWLWGHYLSLAMIWLWSRYLDIAMIWLWGHCHSQVRHSNDSLFGTNLLKFSSVCRANSNG